MQILITLFCHASELIGDPASWDGRPDPYSRLALAALHAVV
jgi:hypothetical protein